MKKFEFIVAALALVAGVMFCSCVKDETDMLPLHDQHQIDFTASSDAEWQNSTRADEEEEPQVMILEMEGDEDLEQPLYLHITCEDRKEPIAEELGMEATRGTTTTTENFAQKFGTGGFGLFAYVYKGEWNDSRTSDYIHDQRVRYHDNTTKWHIHNYDESVLNPSNYYYWPGKNYNIRFFAYAPYRAGYSGHILNIPANGNVYTGAPTIEFKLSDTNKNVFDFCIAKTDQFEGDCNQTVALNFKHALTAIDFVADASMPAGTITNIKFFNIRSRDEIDLEKQEWKSKYSDSIRNVGFATNKKVVLSGGKEQAITGDKDSTTFFLIPHTLREDAYFQVNFTPAGGGTNYLKANLSGMKWEMGKHYTITISPKVVSSQYVLEVTDPSKTNANYLGIVDGHATSHWTTGNVVSYRIDSYRYGLKEPEKVPVKWITEFSVKTGEDTWSDWTYTRPAMFPKFTAGGNGCLDTAEEPDRYGADFAPIIPDDPFNPFGNDIASRPEIPADENPVNLYSKNGNSSANCYVVNAAGTYRFPLVYGNAIKGAKANPDAYAGDIFVDHTGTKIDSPYIPDNYLTNAVAVLLWCDAPQLVTNVSLSTSKMIAASNPVRYIEFTVPKENLTPGNAVIALYDKDPKKKGNEDAVVIWSWHIWVTTWAGEGTTLSANTGYNFTFSKQILGYCPARNASWNDRSVKVRFMQVEVVDGQEKVVNEQNAVVYTFEQTGHKSEYGSGNMPYYQWGRKDPMLAYDYFTNTSDQTSISGQEKRCYSSVLTYNQQTIQLGISKTDVYKGYFGIKHIKGELATNGVTIAESIKNPHVFYSRHRFNTYAWTETNYNGDSSEYDWCSDAIANKVKRWDSDITDYATSVTSDYKTTKTIYDPCPYGWCVPPIGAWRAVSKDLVTNGKYGYASGNDSKTRVFNVRGLSIPITGDRNRYNGWPWQDPSNARSAQFWTSTPRKITKTEHWATLTKSDDSEVPYSGAAYYASSYIDKDTGKGYMNRDPLAMCSGFAILPVEEH